jgi:putative transposase
MSRRARLVIADVPLHIIQRGNNRHPCFVDHRDFLVYLSLLTQHATETGCAIHAYVLMTNHVHILTTPGLQSAPARMMKAIGERYVQYFNRRYARTGTLWDGRFRSCLVDRTRYFLICQRYIELNPVRAGMVVNPGDYPWSSFNMNAVADESTFLKPHSVVRSLGADRQSRSNAYCALFKREIAEDDIRKVRQATNGNFALGGAPFIEAMASQAGLNVAKRKPGRIPRD